MPDLFRQSIGMKNLKYTKYSCVFHTSTCQKNLSPSALVDQFRASLDFSRAFDFAHAMVGAGLSPPGDALAVRTNRRQNGKHHQVCHCEAPTGPWQSREGSCDFADGIPTMRLRTARLPRRFAPRNDNSGKCRGAPMPFSGLRPLYKALTERRYPPYFGFYHFTDSLYKSAVQCRAGTALPLQWRLPF